MGRLFNDVYHAGVIGTLPASVAIGDALSTLGGYAAAGVEYLGVTLGGISATPMIIIGAAVWSSEIGPEQLSVDTSGSKQTHFPMKPSEFVPAGLEQKDFKNGDIIKWMNPSNEWH